MRPENPYKRDNYLGRPDTMKHIAFEAGADAMLEALKKEGRHYQGRCPVAVVITDGWLTFIPDEESDGKTQK